MGSYIWYLVVIFGSLLFYVVSELLKDGQTGPVSSELHSFSSACVVNKIILEELDHFF